MTILTKIFQGQVHNFKLFVKHKGLNELLNIKRVFTKEGAEDNSEAT